MEMKFRSLSLRIDIDDDAPTSLRRRTSTIVAHPCGLTISEKESLLLRLACRTV